MIYRFLCIENILKASGRRVHRILAARLRCQSWTFCASCQRPSTLKNPFWDEGWKPFILSLAFRPNRFGVWFLHIICEAAFVDVGGTAMLQSSWWVCTLFSLRGPRKKYFDYSYSFDVMHWWQMFWRRACETNLFFGLRVENHLLRAVWLKRISVLATKNTLHV